MKLYARARPSEGLYGDGEEAVAARRCARRAVLGLLPLLRVKGRALEAPWRAACPCGRRRRSPAPTGSLLGSENVMSGTRGGGKWRNMPCSSSEYLTPSSLAERLPLAGWPGEPALLPYPKRTGG